MTFLVKHDLKKLEKDLSKVQRMVVMDSLAPAINKVVISVKAISKKTIADETGLKQKTIDKKYRLKLARKNNFNASIDASYSRAYNLITSVTASQRKPNVFNRKNRKGKYRYKGVRANAWKTRKVYRGTFIIPTSRGMLVAKRNGRGKSVDFIHGPSVRQVFRRDSHLSILRDKVRERMPIELKRATQRALRKV